PWHRAVLHGARATCMAASAALGVVISGIIRADLCLRSRRPDRSLVLLAGLQSAARRCPRAPVLPPPVFPREDARGMTRRNWRVSVPAARNTYALVVFLAARRR